LRLHSYVVARDYGFAPNPYFGICTLATCKPAIRQHAKIGDWVVGTGSAERKRRDHIVFAMRVDETLTFTQYWDDHRFKLKRPNLFGSKKSAFGDNIYRKVGGRFVQVDSHHSHPDGSPNLRNIATDTKADRMLIGRDFTYWGGQGPKIPTKFRGTPNVLARRGHKNNFPPEFVQEFVEWINSLGVKGCPGKPLDWDKTP
jgi:hypothetical protein